VVVIERTGVIVLLFLIGTAMTIRSEKGRLSIWTTDRLMALQAPTRNTRPPRAPADADWQRGKEKAQKERLLRGLQYLMNLGALWAIFIFGLSARLKRCACRWTTGARRQTVIYVVIFFLLLGILNLPLDLYTGYHMDRAYGLLTQTFTDWLRDYAVARAVALVILTGVVLGLYQLFGRRFWWAWATLAAVGIIVFLMFVTPVVIAPLFNDFTPLPDGPLKQELLAVARSEGIAAEDIFVVDASRQSRRVNAYVIGVGATQRIVLYDTLLTAFTPEEVTFVLAHEIGHYRRHHIWKFIGAAALAVAFGCWMVEAVGRRILVRVGHRAGVTDRANITSLPLVAFVFLVVMGLAFPLLNTYSRKLEREADHDAIMRTEEEVAVTALEKLGRLNVGEYDASPLVEIIFYDHPSLARRIRFVQEVARTK